MESSLPKYINHKEEFLVTSVDKLKSKSMQTEINLQSPEDQLSSDSSSEPSYSRVPLGLTLEDLEQPSHSEEREIPLSSRRKKMSVKNGESLRRSRDKFLTLPTEVLRNIEQENKELRDKLSSLQERNASLVSQNQLLVNKVEIVQSELKKSKSRVRLFETALGPRTSRIPELEEHVVSLEAEVEYMHKSFALRLSFSCGVKGPLIKPSSIGIDDDLVVDLDGTVGVLNLKSERSSGQERQYCIESKNSELISVLTPINQRILKLESVLENKEKVLKENLEALYVKIQIENSCTTNRQEWNWKFWIKIWRKLSVKEAENKELQAKLSTNNDGVDQHERDHLLSLQEEPVKLMPNVTEEEKSLQLEAVCKQLQTERENLTHRLKDLEGKLNKAQTEVANAKISMAQRTSQFQAIQNELLEKASKTAGLQQDITRKSLKITTLQKQLQEITNEHSACAARTSDLEQELTDCKEQIIHLEQNISKEHEEVLLAFEKSKLIHQDQHGELRKQIEYFQCQMDMKNMQISEQDNTIKSLQHDNLLKQQQLESLDQMLSGTKMEMDLQAKTTHDVIRKLETQVEEETMKVRLLESALAVCKEELELYLQQSEDNREAFENQVKKKSEEVQCLKEELKLRTLSYQETSEENLRLQQTLQQQQQMLLQATARIGDLEDTQAELEKQLFRLEHKVQKERSASEEDKRRTEEKLSAARQELDSKTQQVHELSSTISQLRSELNQYKDKLAQMEEKINSQKRDGETKSRELNHLEMTLQHKQAELEKKTQCIGELEEKLLLAEKDARRSEELESELRTMQEELQDCKTHVKELQEMLTHANLSLEEKKVIIQDLTEELRTCRSELDDRDHELLDMDQALKDRNWELQQRASQLNQLDMSIREHKEEMDTKLLRLESALEKSQLEQKEHIAQITSLDEKLQLAREKLCEKDFDLLQKDQTINQLKKDMERTQLIMSDMEKSIKEQETHITEQQQERMDLSQQVRLAREQMQFTHLQLNETRQQLAEAQQESQRLARKLEETTVHSRQMQEQMKVQLEEAQHSICSLKTELQARNEVIKATNEVLFLKESELTRLKTRISGYERTITLMQQQNSTAFTEHNSMDSSKHYQMSDSKAFGIRRSVSTSDISLNDISSLDLPKSMMEDLRNMLLPDSTPMKSAEDKFSCLSSDSFNDSSFNPLSYAVDENCDVASDSTDLDTLSGMLKYIKKEMKISETSNAHSTGQGYVG
ncbi:LOW QUALITY PROTEIN: coiled-coil domain-containing protein 18 [Bombina bombina]|uniref:LOW QUALITY PROTEIN: coiled-coil domain-containing protein 18 n=1 Tax=Bombina bombina TaxID=8345 RepID=UPI00235AD658|nr:LOW QUALITY PROTEIN: coiled-coil domain-containing protein 18 [Bombina bombina]